jgi:hypothetical protein
MMQGAWGEAYARDIEKYTRFAGMWICGEDLPQAGNRITRDATKKDRFGLADPTRDEVAFGHQRDRPWRLR